MGAWLALRRSDRPPETLRGLWGARRRDPQGASHAPRAEPALAVTYALGTEHADPAGTSHPRREQVSKLNTIWRNAALTAGRVVASAADAPSVGRGFPQSGHKIPPLVSLSVPHTPPQCRKSCQGDQFEEDRKGYKRIYW